MPNLVVIGGTVALATVSILYLLRVKQKRATDTQDAAASDPGLLKKHSTLKSYTGAGVIYPGIRTFYHPHPQADKLPTKPVPLPLLVFVHGLGGSAAQFAPLLTGLVHAAPCLAIDLPGCGLSEFEPQTAEAYKSESLAALIAEAINQHRDAENGQKVILIGHSMGCSLTTLLASSTSPLSGLISDHVGGMIAICPRAEPLSARQAARLQHMRYVPLTLFDLFRAWDRRGGTESASVSRYAGEDADPETKRLQLRFNEQSKSEVFMAMAFGSMPDYSSGMPVGGLPGEEIWSGLRVPTFCIGGEADHVTPPENVEMIAKWLGRHVPGKRLEMDDDALPAAAGEVPIIDHTFVDGEDGKAADRDIAAKPAKALLAESRPADGMPDVSKRPKFVLKTAILPKPASHALLYSTSTVRIVSGLIQSFFTTHVDHRLSLGWQLQHLSTEGKWDVKNLQKWQAIEPVSEPIGGIFRAQKTLREVDEEHTPKVYAKRWGAKQGNKQGVRMIVDISHESPVYDPKGLEEGGIEYHKFPTVSKLPPTVEEVTAFIALIDALREQLAKPDEPEGALIGVHCHYGFNRTGFFLVCYMVERLGYRLHDALEEFAEKRPPGIRHEHFVNELFVRYMVGLQRRPTLC